MTTGTAIIIGVGPGLGASIAKAFATEGHAVALIARDGDRLQQLADTLGADGAEVRAFRADVTDASALRAAINQAATELGAPDVVVYNTGVVRADAPTELEAEEWTKALFVNVTGAQIMTKTAVPLMRNGKGSILFTGGGLALHPAAQYASLSVGKAALRAYALALNDSLKGTEIHAATVTIAGAVGSGELRFEPDRIARTYVDLAREPKEEWRAEVIYN